jgi:methylenetetrahydrofolate dehydrogenase (NADP+)/methenyltetrahydrofolate cyclohydrolase
MKLIDGKNLAQQIRSEVKDAVSKLPSPPGLGVLLVGEDPASHVYVNLKEKAAQEAGITADIRRMSETTSDDELETIILGWNNDPTINAILIQLPLPAGHNTDRLINAMDPAKDVDGFHPQTIQGLMRGDAMIVSPVHEAILRLIAATNFDPRGKSATILANSETFATPLAYLMQRAGFITAFMNPEVIDGEILRTSDVIILAIGRPGFLGADLVRPGTIVIDVGTTKDERGIVRGDADETALASIDGWLTPVPGGVGPMTVALLLKNVLTLAKDKKG